MSCHILLLILILALLSLHAHSYDYYYDSYRFNEDFDDEEDVNEDESETVNAKTEAYLHSGVPTGSDAQYAPSESPGMVFEHLKFPGYKLKRFHVANMSLTEFQRECQYGEGQPCVIEGYTWPAMKKWFNISQAFGELLKDHHVDVSVLKRVSEGRYAGTVTERNMLRMPFSEYYQRVFGKSKNEEAKEEPSKRRKPSRYHSRRPRHKLSSKKFMLYMNNWHFSRTNPELLSDITIPEPFQIALSKNLAPRQYSRLFWIYIGAQGSYSLNHLDVLHTSAWLAPLRGRKLWYFFHPEFGPHFDYNPFQNINQKHLVRYEHVLEPGQVIFVPSKWWHYVRNLPGLNEDPSDPEHGASVAITQNFVDVFNLKNVYEQLIEIENLSMARDFAKLLAHPETQKAIAEYDMLMAEEDKKKGATGRESLQDYLKRQTWHKEFYLGGDEE